MKEVEIGNNLGCTLMFLGACAVLVALILNGC